MDWLNQLVVNFEQLYVFPDKAKELKVYIDEERTAESLSKISSREAQIEFVQKQLDHVLKDKHVRIRATIETETADVTEPQGFADPEFDLRLCKFGFTKVERLPGNLGDLNINGFFPIHPYLDRVVASAFNFVSGTDGLVIDLRENGGGSPASIALVASYLVGDSPEQLSSIYWRPTDQTNEFWT